MYVFRDGRRVVPGQRLVSELRTGLEALSGESRRDQILDALITAGELECALIDAGAAGEEMVQTAAGITDSLAEMLLSTLPAKSPAGAKGNTDADRPGYVGKEYSISELQASLQRIEPPAQLQLSVHEGFAYYALHPLKIDDLFGD